MLLRMYTARIQPDIIVLEFSGKIITGPESQEIEKEVHSQLALNEKKFIFDLTGVDYVDSTGMGIIAQCFATVMRADGGFRVAGASGKVQQLFRTTRLDTILTFYPTVAAASQNFAIGWAAGAQNPW